MSQGFTVKGWCPGALRPMASGDGLVLRIRPRCGRLTAAQAMLIAALSQRYGNGVMDLTSRANLQLRGLAAQDHGALLTALRGAGLIDDSLAAESQRNVILSPFADENGPAWRIAQALSARLAAKDAPILPPKFGFAVESAPSALQDAPAYIRILSHGRDWQVMPDGAHWALPALTSTAADIALKLAGWFLAQGGGTGTLRRMRDLAPTLPAPNDAQPMHLSPSPHPRIGAAPNGWMPGFAFGQITAAQLHEAARHGDLRLTPWRALLIEGLALPPRIPGAILDPCDVRLRIHACTGAPRCPQGLADMRALADQLAPHLPQGLSLHLSGCAKGCAHPRAAAWTLRAVAGGRFDLISNGTARDAAMAFALRPDQAIQFLSGPPAGPAPKDQGTL